MKPEDVPQEWVKKAADAWYASGDETFRDLLAAVIPLIQAAAYEEAARIAATDADYLTPGEIADLLRKEGART